MKSPWGRDTVKIRRLLLLLAEEALFFCSDGLSPADTVGLEGEPRGDEEEGEPPLLPRLPPRVRPEPELRPLEEEEETDAEEVEDEEVRVAGDADDNSAITGSVKRWNLPELISLRAAAAASSVSKVTKP